MQRQRERVIMALTVMGAGFGRTGTLSLKAALEELGLGPCYHMREAIQRVDHVPKWESAARGETVDWDRFLGSYRATVDWPGAAFYDQLSQNYPEARVILTVRDPDRWYDSASATIYDIGKAGASPLSVESPRVNPDCCCSSLAHSGLCRPAAAVKVERPA